MQSSWIQFFALFSFDTLPYIPLKVTYSFWFSRTRKFTELWVKTCYEIQMAVILKRHHFKTVTNSLRYPTHTETRKKRCLGFFTKEHTGVIFKAYSTRLMSRSWFLSIMTMLCRLRIRSFEFVFHFLQSVVINNTQQVQIDNTLHL